MSVKAIEAATESWATAFNRGDAAGCAAHYHPEARLHGQPFPANEGRDSIEVFWQKLIEEGYTDVRYLDRQIELTPAGSAIVTSPWSMNRARGMITREEWQKDSTGKWLIMSDEFEILDNNPIPKLPRPVVLLHGAWMGAWCWGVTQEELGAAGVTTKAMDLPGHGKRSAESVGDSLTPYVDAAVETISACDAPVVLVGHSFGGIVISQIAERVPEKIDALVYLAAAVAPDGGTFLETVGQFEGPSGLSNLEFNEAKTLVTIEAAAFQDAVAHDIDEKAFAAAGPDLVHEPTGPLGATLQISRERYGRVPRFYIRCTGDRLFPLTGQDAMLGSVVMEGVYSLDASHSPMLSQPGALAKIIAEIAAR